MSNLKNPHFYYLRCHKNSLKSKIRRVRCSAEFWVLDFVFYLCLRSINPNLGCPKWLNPKMRKRDERNGGRTVYTQEWVRWRFYLLSVSYCNKWVGFRKNCSINHQNYTHGLTNQMTARWLAIWPIRAIDESESSIKEISNNWIDSIRRQYFVVSNWTWKRDEKWLI